jgi:glycosyltransferase involved in cell wall biosynthesis
LAASHESVVPQMRRVLIVAYHFPPLAGSSGVQRALRFAQHLPRFGWEAVVLSCVTRAYSQIDAASMDDVPSGTVVERAFALDAARHLAVRGHYPAWLARPDRWVSWWPDAVRRGMRLLHNRTTHAILSTYPIATAHLIGHSLARRSGLPWVADFRDPMAQDGYPADPRTWASFKRIEERAFARAAACTFTTPSAASLYRDRYPASSSRVEVIENGYDEEAFLDITEAAAAKGPLVDGVITLLHSGIVYPDERDPTHLFIALAQLKARGIDARRLRVRFRAPVHESLLRTIAQRHDVEAMIEVAPAVPYQEALAEMLRADGLLILQAANCNAQVPAKLYEYLRARRPILALTDPAGDTAAVLRASGCIAVAPLDDAAAIVALLARVIRGQRDGTIASDAAIARASRLGRAEQLARLLDSVSTRGAQ